MMAPIVEKEKDIDLLDALKRLEAFMSHSPVVAFMKDREGRYVYANPRLASVFNTEFSSFIGSTDFDWLPRDIATKIKEHDDTVLSTNKTIEITEEVPHPDGSLREWQVFKFPFKNDAGETFVGGLAIDITARMKAEEELRASERRYRLLMEKSQGLIFTHDLEGNLLSVNKAACASLGYEASEMIGKNLLHFLSPSADALYRTYLESINLSETTTGNLWMTTRDGRELVLRYTTVKMSEAGKDTYVLGNAQDITELAHAQQRSESLSLVDELTSLYNRRGFLQLAEHRLDLARRTKEELIVLFADMDGLKKINDLCGHRVGSQAISKTAEILKDSFRHSDIISRWGGDEFVILFARQSVESTQIVVDRVMKKLADFNEKALHPYKLSLSIGVTRIDCESAATVEEIIAKADTAMYEHKQSKAEATNRWFPTTDYV